MKDSSSQRLDERHNDAADRMAVGVKTALIVCAVGFVALVANRALVSPAANAVEAPTLHAAAAVRAPAAVPADEPKIARPAAARDAEEYEGGDNHPPSF